MASLAEQEPLCLSALGQQVVQSWVWAVMLIQNKLSLLTRGFKG